MISEVSLFRLREERENYRLYFFPQPPPGNLALNATFEVSPGSLALPPPADLEDHLSVTSDASSGQRRLTSMGDVQHVVKMQEQSEKITDYSTTQLIGTQLIENF